MFVRRAGRHFNVEQARSRAPSGRQQWGRGPKVARSNEALGQNLGEQREWKNPMGC